MWWFFAMIMLASYTANLAAFLTKEGMESTIESVQALADQTVVKYGAVLEGATLAFFQGSNVSLYQKMYDTMAASVATGSVFTKSNNQGAERVLKSKKQYAFFMENTLIDYFIERNCNLTKIGEPLDSKGYGIALPLSIMKLFFKNIYFLYLQNVYLSDSRYRKKLNEAILDLNERGKLKGLKNKWWKEKKGGGQCNTESKNAESGLELGVDHVGGVFVVLLGGLFAGLTIGVLEFLWHVKDIAVEEKVLQLVIMLLYFCFCK